MKTAVVTGASGGIGSAIARRLAADGFAVVVGYHQAAKRVESLVSDLPGHGHQATRIAVQDPVSLADLARSLVESPGSLDVLVNCAGVTQPVPHDDLEALDDATIDEIFTTGAIISVDGGRPLGVT